MATVMRTTPTDLARIAKERGRVYDPKQQAAWCSECGSPLGAFGILHWPDCSGSDDEIRFRDLD
jgi:hypothetical protein